MTEQVDTTTERRTDQINLSSVAAAKVKSLLEQEGRDDLQLRISVQPGGCSGLRYQLFFDERTLDGDVVTDFDDVSVVVDRMSVPYLNGAEIDFVDSIEKQGFTIRLVRLWRQFSLSEQTRRPPPIGGGLRASTGGRGEARSVEVEVDGRGQACGGLADLDPPLRLLCGLLVEVQARRRARRAPGGLLQAQVHTGGAAVGVHLGGRREVVGRGGHAATLGATDGYYQARCG